MRNKGDRKELQQEVIKEWRKEVAEKGFAKCPNQNCQLCFLSSKGKKAINNKR